MGKTQSKKLKALVVGYGSIGRRHAENFRTLGVRDIFFLRHAKKGRVPKNHFIDLKQALIQKPDIAVIANPTSLHLPVAMRLAKAGIHLFIEKPLSNSTRGVSGLMRIVKNKKLVTMIGYNFRFHPQLIQIKKLTESGAIGKVLSARVEVGQYLPDWHPGEDYRAGYAAKKSLGGGVILTLIHEIDYLSWILGKPRRVFCLADKVSNLEIDVEDVAEILIQYDNGALGEAHLDYLQRVPRRNLEIIGEKGTILWDYFAGEIKVYRNKKWSTHKLFKNWKRNQMFVDEMAHFLDCVVKKKETMIPIAAGWDSLKTALAAKKSTNTGKLINL